MTDDSIFIQHQLLGKRILHGDGPDQLLFCDNESNPEKLYSIPCNKDGYYKDGINNYIVNGANTVNPGGSGTKAAFHFNKIIPAGKSEVVRLRLSPGNMEKPFKDFDSIFELRIKEADVFYAEVQQNLPNEEYKKIQRQAYAGMIWCKQFYDYNIEKWLNGDPTGPPPPAQRKKGRNHNWRHLNSADIISMPDSWEYPWFAAWDLAFHCICFADIDPDFSKKQLTLLTHEWYMHPNGQLPAYEWAFSDVNPPVHAWATWKVYKLDKECYRHWRHKISGNGLHEAIVEFHLVGKPQRRTGK